MNRIKNLIDKIYNESLPEDEIIWTALPKELRWSWTNTRTSETWYLKLSDVLTSVNRNDPDGIVLMNFLNGTKGAFEAKNELGRLEKLKVFW